MRSISIAAFALGLILSTLVGHGHSELTVEFYKGKCGYNDVEKIIHNAVKKKLKDDQDTVSDLVRLSYHDCFVRGCDGSIFLDGPDTEKAAIPSRDLGGFDTIDDIKKAVEDACPELVSCADILVMATRSAISLTGGRWFEVETGRRDSLVSFASEALANIPPPTVPIPQAIQIFEERGLTVEDFVVLMGGHTVGTAHCHSFDERLYNFQNTNQPDPSMSMELLQLLQSTCPLNSNANHEAFLDQTPNSHFTVDNDYYNQVLAYNGTMEIDQNLAFDPQTCEITKTLAKSPNKVFLSKFSRAMVKMARIGVLTGNDGEIRKTCTAVNN